MAEQKKLSIISMSGDFDKVIAVFTLASGAAAVGYPKHLMWTSIPLLVSVGEF